MTVGEKIYILRTKAGLSQEKLAEKIGVSRQSVSKWETNVTIPDTEYVIKISKVLCVSLDALLLAKDVPEPEPERAIKYVDPEVESTLSNLKKLSIVGFVFSIVMCFVGLVLCSIAAKREKKLFDACTHMTVAGLSISIALFFALVVIVTMVSIFFALYGGLQWF